MTEILTCAAMLRVKQWLKNFIVFLPIVIVPGSVSFQNLTKLLLVFALFCCCSSMVYIINDWTDRHADALHPTKKTRPFASGALNGWHGAIGLATAAAVAGSLTWKAYEVDHLLPILISLYLMQSAFYSFWLKSVALLEMMIVSTGYIYRALAGGLAVDLVPSPWILMTIFLASIFMVAFKRLSDLNDLEDAASVRASFESYSREYLLMIAGVSASSAVVSYMLFTLSTYARDTFSNQYLPVTSVFIIYAVFRYTQIAIQSPLAGDPIKLILRDTHLMICIGLCAAFISVTNGLDAGL